MYTLYHINHVYAKYLDRRVANGVDPDQAAPLVKLCTVHSWDISPVSWGLGGKEKYLGIIVGYFFLYFLGTHEKHLAEGLLMSTYNICFDGELEKIIPELSSNTPP